MSSEQRPIKLSLVDEVWWLKFCPTTVLLRKPI